MEQDRISDHLRAGRVVLPMAPAATCCGTHDAPAVLPPRLDQGFVVGSLDGPQGKIPRVSARIGWLDHWGTIKARVGAGRMHYAIDPGLYALGAPDEQAPVVVSANYKMSFDSLRQALPARNVWILVLDTKGINVWCAAGKGTFGTEELVHRIAGSGLADIVKHRTLILPQLGAPGVAAHTVKRLAGFTVKYGPIRAVDLPAYLDSGMQATPVMRRITFPFKERAVLIPIELNEALKAGAIVIPILFIVSGFLGTGGFAANLLHEGLFTILALASAILAGTVFTPLLLPYLPGRAFSTKGFTIGAITAIFLMAGWGYEFSTARSLLNAGAWLLMISAISAYLAMNFTGASTYTSLSGVKREMRWALPLEIGTGVVGLVAWLLTPLV